jgi:2-keto-4-pentenoate hydratase
MGFGMMNSSWISPIRLLPVLVAATVIGACSRDSTNADTAAAEPSGCPSDELIELYLGYWRAAQPAPPLGAGGTLEDAYCSQAKIVDRLVMTLGPAVGYKAGLTSAAAQETFGASEPVRGVLLAGTFLENGAEVPISLGPRLRFEADMILVVENEAINGATTVEDVLANVGRIIPFIELPDLSVEEAAPLDGVVLAAINVAARSGVLGEPIPVQRTPEFLQALADMTVKLVDQNGTELMVAPGRAILDHPLNSVLWLLGSGVELHAGDYISLGSFGSLLVPEPGQTITMLYEGLPGSSPTTVRFR